jgi:hypothetical protein
VESAALCVESTLVFTGLRAVAASPVQACGSCSSFERLRSEPNRKYVQAGTLQSSGLDPVILGSAIDHRVGKIRGIFICETAEVAAAAPGGWGSTNHRSITLWASRKAAELGEASLGAPIGRTLAINLGLTRTAGGTP